MAVDEVELEQLTGQAASDWAASFGSALVPFSPVPEARS